MAAESFLWTVLVQQGTLLVGPPVESLGDHSMSCNGLHCHWFYHWHVPLHIEWLPHMALRDSGLKLEEVAALQILGEKLCGGW